MAFRIGGFFFLKLKKLSSILRHECALLHLEYTAPFNQVKLTLRFISNFRLNPLLPVPSSLFTFKRQAPRQLLLVAYSSQSP
jgi:hypothetical protein